MYKFMKREAREDMFLDVAFFVLLYFLHKTCNHVNEGRTHIYAFKWRGVVDKFEKKRILSSEATKLSVLNAAFIFEKRTKTIGCFLGF